MLMEFGSKQLPNRRKQQKSLGLCSSNFLSLYNREGIETIKLDDAAERLGVVRRRIYDIVNILESILARKGQKCYTWKGFEAIPKALNDLKREGLIDVRENWTVGDTSCFENVSDRISAIKSSARPKSRKVKSLGLITQNFIKLFLCTDMEIIYLDDAVKLLLGVGKHTKTTMRTTIRRLYDIVNVLSSMNIIDKIRHPFTRKCAIRWLGVTGISYSKTAVDPRIKKESSGNEAEHTIMASKSHQFGPSVPAEVPNVGESVNKNRKEAIDYKQALQDLSSYYAEAWKLWYDEVVG